MLPLVLSFFISISLVGSEKVYYNGSQVLRIAGNLSSNVLDSLETRLLIKRWRPGDENSDFLVKADNINLVKNALDKNRILYKVFIKDVQEKIDCENPSRDSISPRYFALGKGHKMTWNRYHRIRDIHGYLDYLGNTYRDVVEVFSLGNSVEGKPLKAIRISFGSENHKAIWLDGGIHAREWISVSSMTYVIKALVENNEEYYESMKGIDFYILPILNPDGYEFSHIDDRMWRKNRGYNSIAYCKGTDLNRNYGYMWASVGVINNSCAETFPGKRPFSEPETSSVARFAVDHRHKIKAYVSFHSYSQAILFPWAYTNKKHIGDHEDLLRVGEKIGRAMHKVNGHKYKVGTVSDVMYPAAGGMDDWVRGSLGIKYTYTIELPDTGEHGFILPAKLIIPIGEEVLEAVKVLVEEVHSLP